MLPTPVPPSPSELAVPKVLFKGRLVSGKKSNSPFFVHQRHKSKQLNQLEGERQPMATGAPKGQQTRVMTAQSAFLKNLTKLSQGSLKYSLVTLLFSLILSRMITEQWFWGYEGKYVQWSYYFPGPQTIYTVESLAEHDGVRDPSKPLLLAIDGDVYQVDSNRAMYGPGGSYHHFVGRDASRAFATGCFKTGLTYDTRGFTARQKKALTYWSNFFANSPKYPRVGRMIRPAIDPNSPLPIDCDPKVEGGAI